MLSNPKNQRRKLPTTPLDKLSTEVIGQAALLSYAEPDVEKMRQLAQSLRQIAIEIAPEVTPAFVRLPHSSDAGVAVIKYIAAAYYTFYKESSVSAEALYGAACILEQKSYYKRSKRVSSPVVSDGLLPELELIGRAVIRDGGSFAVYENFISLGGRRRIDDAYEMMIGRVHLSLTGQADPVNQFILLYLLYVIEGERDLEYLSYSPHLALGDLLYVIAEYEDMLSIGWGDR